MRKLIYRLRLISRAAMSVPKNQQDVVEFVRLCKLDKNGILRAPVLYNMNTRGKFLLWRIFVSLEDVSNPNRPMTYGIEQKFINRSQIPEDVVAVYWTESGQEGGAVLTSEKTTIEVGKNIGRSNFTTPLTQAILDARSLYLKKIRKGSVTSKSKIRKVGEVVTFEDLANDTNRGPAPWRIFAMAMHNYNKFKRHITYPATVQAKLDGTLFIVVRHPLLPEVNGRHIDGYSRRRETYETQDHILEELYPILESHPGWHIVGELWKRGHVLQDVSGSARRKVDSRLKSKAVLLNFNIFDCFRIDQPELGFMDRQAKLDEIFAPYNNLADAAHLKRIETVRVKNEAEMMTHYESYLRSNLEGAIVRNLDAPYEFGLNREKRTYKTLKIKPRDDAEWPIVGYTDGRQGKEVGAVIWTLAENDEGVKKRTGELLPIAERRTFNVTPNQPYNERYFIFSKLESDSAVMDRVRGKPYTIQYTRLSTDHLPQEPKGLHFRDTKIDDWLLKGFGGGDETGPEENEVGSQEGEGEGEGEVEVINNGK
jgi:ATP dependent DNA ligase domain